MPPLWDLSTRARGERLTLQSPVPPDFAQLLGVLREDARDAAQVAGLPRGRKSGRAR